MPLLRLRRMAALGAATACLIALQPALAARLGESAQHRQAAESERAELRKRLAGLKRDMARTETARSHAADALAESESAISEANRLLHALAQEQSQAQARLERLTAEQRRLEQAVASQRARLAKLLHDQYVAGNEDRLRLLLSGDDPNRINRELHYLGYVSQAQARLIDGLRADLAAVDLRKEDVREARDELDEIAAEQREQKSLLEKEQGRRAALLAHLSGQLAAQRRQAGNLERDEQRLAALVDRLSILIEEQRRADAARERQRREQLARAKTKRPRDAASAAGPEERSKTAGNNPDAIDADEPPAKSAARNELASPAGVQNAGPATAFASLRGRLALPARGELAARYGGKREDGPSWKGIFIRAAEGASVRAVAPGKVVFAEWLRGFGNLVIVDHGDGYLSIYGNNQAMLKQAGDPVRGGDAIASVGNSGGNEHSGLYFELRHQGRALDPLAWMSASLPN